ncbi:hypothetical protein SASPL_139495 [Salvia splendens]|uniref:Uncharacterized protein n=1 Tax=Salvia splendens TaxID=180675 RepID=A0A8X8WP38_SALSN|nr:hypothetical protein SASPL_139495 [Salvia splendens]
MPSREGLLLKPVHQELLVLVGELGSTGTENIGKKMKGFEKGMSPSNRILPSSGSVENNENDSNGEKLSPTNNKTAYGKHFMPGVPRKKVLAEIKGIPKASVAALATKTPILTLKESPEKGSFRFICEGL